MDTTSLITFTAFIGGSVLAAKCLKAEANCRWWQCSWCKENGNEVWFSSTGIVQLSEPTAEQGFDGVVSHGMCADCESRARKENGLPAKETLTR